MKDLYDLVSYAKALHSSPFSDEEEPPGLISVHEQLSSKVKPVKRLS